MRISDVQIFSMFDGWRNITYLRLATEEGLTGLGEMTLANREDAAIAHAKVVAQRYVIGSDPFNTEALWRRIYLGDFWRGGPVASAVLSGIDMACHDLMGKKLGVPVWKLIGGKVREKVPCYANGWYTEKRDPQRIAIKAKEVIDFGYTALKIDPFGAGDVELSRDEFNLSIEILEVMRETLGPDIDIFVEGHARFNIATASRLASAMEPFNPGWFEEPCTWDDPLAWGEVRGRTSIPIAGGEHFHTRYGYKEIFEQRAVDYLQPDILYCGGFTEMRKIAAMAEAYGIIIAPHNSNGPLCFTASVHFATACQNFKILECFDDWMQPHVKQSLIGGISVKNGYAEASDRPGLGVELNEEVIAQHPAQPYHFDLWKEGWEKRFKD